MCLQGWIVVGEKMFLQCEDECMDLIKEGMRLKKEKKSLEIRLGWGEDRPGE